MKRTIIFLIFICRIVIRAEFDKSNMLEFVLSELNTFKTMMETCTLKLKITESLQTRMASLEDQVADLKEQNKQLNNRIQEVEGSLQQLEFLNTSLEEQTGGSVLYKAGRYAISQDLSQETQQKTRQTDQGAARVAFTAGVSVQDLQYLGYHHTIIFDRAISNIGQAYHPNTGIFLAPVKGVYVFTVTLMVPANHNLYIEIVVDGQYVNDLLAEGANVDNYVSTTRQWILDINQSSEVWIRTRNGGWAHGNMHTSFSGFLLYETE